MIRQTGLALGVAVLVAVLGTTAHHGGAALDAFRHAWWVTSAISFAGIVPALALLRRPRPAEPAPDDGAVREGAEMATAVPPAADGWLPTQPNRPISVRRPSLDPHTAVGWPVRLTEEGRLTTVAMPDDVFIYIGTYPSEEAARADSDLVEKLHKANAVGTFDAALVTKDKSGKVHIQKDESATRHAGWGGAAAGALVGLLLPPALIGTALVGAAIGGMSGHLWRGLSRSDFKELGETIDAGGAALVVVGANRLEQTLNTSEFSADHFVVKQLDVSSGDLDAAVQEAAKELN